MRGTGASQANPPGVSEGSVIIETNSGGQREPAYCDGTD
jgi:hypothetical protein